MKTLIRAALCLTLVLLCTLTPGACGKKNPTPTDTSAEPAGTTPPPSGEVTLTGDYRIVMSSSPSEVPSGGSRADPLGHSDENRTEPHGCQG